MSSVYAVNIGRGNCCLLLFMLLILGEGTAVFCCLCC
jgi:hypothetical protein